jgi:hypothetical protein
MQLQIDTDRLQWQHYFTGWIAGTMRSSYRVGPVAWHLFVVCPCALIDQLGVGHVVEATIAHDGCGVMVEIHHRLDQPTPGQPITLLSAYQQPMPPHATSG